MKTTTLALLLSLLLFSCRNTISPATTAITTDTLSKPVINKLITNSSSNSINTNDLSQTLQVDSVNESDVLIAGYPIMTLSEQKMGKLLSKADSIRRDSNKEINTTINSYHIKKSSFDYWNRKLFGFRIPDNHLPFSILGKKIKIGDNMEKLKSIFPISYSNIDKSIPQKNDTTVLLVKVNEPFYRVLIFNINAKRIIWISMVGSPPK